jgi:hypothetical protein
MTGHGMHREASIEINASPEAVYPPFRTSLSDLSHFCVAQEVLYNLLTIRGDCHARSTPLP